MISKLRAAIRRLARAEVAYSRRGAQAPEDIAQIEAELRAAKSALRLELDRLKGKK